MQGCVVLVIVRNRRLLRVDAYQEGTDKAPSQRRSFSISRPRRCREEGGDKTEEREDGA
jgi:hypothetical protein